MENPDHPRSKRTVRRNNTAHVSMSDADPTTSPPDTWHSPLSESAPRSDDASFQPDYDKNANSQVPGDRFYSPLPSPGKANLPASSGVRKLYVWPRSEKHVSENADFLESGGHGSRGEKSIRESHDSAAAKGGSSAVLGMDRLTRHESMQVVKKVGAVGGGGGLEEGYGGGGQDAVGGGAANASRRTVGVSRAALMFRVFEVAVCLISFSVMAKDKTQGWSGDSFDRYIEYRFCLAVNIIGFVYSGFQALGLACHLGTGKHVVAHHWHYHFDFLMDQILAYLLLSASSCAATRVVDWISNWGKDEFTLLASASVAMSFLAFIAFALSSIISGYNLCSRDSS